MMNRITDKQKRVREKAELVTSLPEDSPPFPQVFQALLAEFTRKNSFVWSDLQYWDVFMKLLNRMTESIALDSLLCVPLQQAFLATFGFHGSDFKDQKVAKKFKFSNGEQELTDVSEMRSLITMLFGRLMLRFSASFRPSLLHFIDFFIPILEFVVELPQDEFRALFEHSLPESIFASATSSSPTTASTSSTDDTTSAVTLTTTSSSASPSFVIDLEDSALLASARSGGLFILLSVLGLQSYQDTQNPRRMFDTVVNKLLGSLLLLQSRLELVDTQFSCWLLLLVSNCITSSLFDKSHLQGYATSLITAQRQEHTTYQKRFFEQLEFFLKIKPSNVPQTVAAGKLTKQQQAELICLAVPSLFRGYLASWKEYEREQQEKENEDIVSAKSAQKQDLLLQRQTDGKMLVYNRLFSLLWSPFAAWWAPASASASTTATASSTSSTTATTATTSTTSTTTTSTSTNTNVSTSVTTPAVPSDSSYGAFSSLTKMKAVAQLIQFLAEFQVYHSNLDPDNNHATLLQAHLTKILDFFFKTHASSTAVATTSNSFRLVVGFIAQSVRAFILINPHLIEGWLDKIFLLASWGLSLPEEHLARKEILKTLNAVTDVFFKLRQFDTLILSFFKAIQVQNSGDNKYKIVWDVVSLQKLCPSLALQISFLPALQISKLWQLFTDTMEKFPPRTLVQKRVYASTFSFFLQHIEVSEVISETLLSLFFITIKSSSISSSLTSSSSAYFDVGSVLHVLYGLNVVKDKCEAWKTHAYEEKKNSFALTPFAHANVSLSISNLRSQISGSNSSQSSNGSKAKSREEEAKYTSYLWSEYNLRKFAIQRICHAHAQLEKAKFEKKTSLKGEAGKPQAQQLFLECTELGAHVFSVLPEIFLRHQTIVNEEELWEESNVVSVSHTQYLLGCWLLISASLNVLLWYSTPVNLRLIQQILLHSFMSCEISISAASSLLSAENETQLASAAASSSSSSASSCSFQTSITELFQDSSFYEMQQLRNNFVLVTVDIVKAELTRLCRKDCSVFTALNNSNINHISSSSSSSSENTPFSRLREWFEKTLDSTTCDLNTPQIHQSGSSKTVETPQEKSSDDILPLKKLLCMVAGLNMEYILPAHVQTLVSVVLAVESLVYGGIKSNNEGFEQWKQLYVQVFLACRSIVVNACRTYPHLLVPHLCREKVLLRWLVSSVAEISEAFSQKENNYFQHLNELLLITFTHSLYSSASDSQSVVTEATENILSVLTHLLPSELSVLSALPVEKHTSVACIVDSATFFVKGLYQQQQRQQKQDDDDDEEQQQQQQHVHVRKENILLFTQVLSTLLPFLLEQKPHARLCGSILDLFAQVLALDCAFTTSFEKEEGKGKVKKAHGSSSALLNQITNCLKKSSQILQQNAQEENEACKGAARFISSVCYCFNFFSPTPSDATFSFLLYLLFRFTSSQPLEDMCNEDNDTIDNNNSIDNNLSRILHKAFLHLLANASSTQLTLTVHLLLDEFHVGLLSHITTALLFFQEVNKKRGKGTHVVTETKPMFLACLNHIASSISAESNYTNDKNMNLYLLTNLTNNVLSSCVARVSTCPLSPSDMNMVALTINLLSVHLSRQTYASTLRAVFACVKYRSNLVHHKISLFLKCLRNLLLCCLEGIDKQLNGGSVWPDQFTQDLTRLLRELCTEAHKRQLQKYIPYFLCDYVSGIKKFALAGTHKRILLVGIFSVMRICSEYEFKLVHAALDPAGKILFKSVHSEYSKSGFSGKV